MPRKPPAKEVKQITELPLGETVYRRIRSAITEGRYRPGERVREPDIVDWLSVSRTPVREALHRLQQDELLVATPHGLVVPQLDPDQVQELYEVRQILEGAAARLAAQRASDSEIALLAHIVEQEAASCNDLPARVALNKRFHAGLLSAARNRYLVKSLRMLWDVFRLTTQSPLSYPGRLATSLTEHQDIIRALESRDPDQAEAALRAHTRQAQKIRLLMTMTEVDRNDFS